VSVGRQLIEKTCGQSIAHWLAVLHGLGHGHANALVAYARAQKKS
jgi:hypothetical protein